MTTLKQKIAAYTGLVLAAGSMIAAANGREPVTDNRAGVTAEQGNLEIGPFATEAAAQAQIADLRAHGIRCYLLVQGNAFYVRTY